MTLDYDDLPEDGDVWIKCDAPRLRRDVISRITWRNCTAKLGVKRMIAESLLFGLRRRHGSYSRAARMLQRKRMKFIVDGEKVDDGWRLFREGADHDAVKVIPSVVDSTIARHFGCCRVGECRPMTAFDRQRRRWAQGIDERPMAPDGGRAPEAVDAVMGRWFGGGEG